MTQWDVENTLYDAEITKRLYINYGQHMVKNLKKIYLAPYAQNQSYVFEYMIARSKEQGRTTNDIKVRLSTILFGSTVKIEVYSVESIEFLG